MQNSTILSENPVKTLTETSTVLQISETNGIQTVSARELHKGLNISKRFSEWFSINSRDFIENVDFTSVLTSTVVNNGAKRELQDYAISIDMAKAICLMSRTEIGKQYRTYLINLEKAWNNPEMVMKRALEYAIKKADQLYLECQIMQPKADFYDKVTGSSDTCDMKEVAKILNFKNIGRNTLFEILRNENVLDKNNQPYQRYVDAGYFRIIESKWEDKDGDTHINLKTVVYQKGVDYIRKLVLKNPGYLENAVESAAENWIKEND